MELLRALAVIAEGPSPEAARLAPLLELGATPTPEEHAQLFTFELYPYASVYVGAEGMLGGEARDRVAGFWRALGETPPVEPDHLAALLALYAHLSAIEETVTPARRPAVRHTRAALLWEHLLPWLPAYLDKLRGLATPVYARWQALLRDALVAEARALPAPRDSLLPLHLRATPALPGADAPGDEWLAALLAPVRCGLILTRSDIARAATSLGLGLRAGERRFALQALITQDDAMFDWLADEAAASRRAHLAWESVTGPLARFWAGRAGETEAALRSYRIGDPSGTSRSGWTNTMSPSPSITPSVSTSE